MYLNYLNMFNACLKNKITGVGTPLRVKHYITFRCNMNCHYCYTKEFGTPRGTKFEMSTEQIKKAMREFRDMGTQQWTFIGGEPLLRPDIGILIDYAKEMGFMVNVSTNGTFINSKIDCLKNADHVLISLEGPKELHDSICTVPCFDRVVQGIEALHKIGIKPLINTVISKANEDYIDYLVDFGLKHDVHVNFTLVYPLNKTAEEYAIPSQRILKVAEKILSLKKKYKHISCSNEAFNRNALYAKGVIPRFQVSPCLAGKMYLDILPDGTLAPCYARFADKGPSGLKLGFKKAYSQMKDYGKCDCTIDAHYNLNLVSSLDFKRCSKSALNLIRGRWVFS